MKLRLPLSLASFLIAALLQTSFAANYTWSGNAGNNAWTTNGNWNPNGNPGSSSDFDEASFDDTSASDSTILLSSTVRLNKLLSTISDQKKLTLVGGTLLLGGGNPLFYFNGDMTLSLTGAITLQSNLTIKTNLSNVLIEGSTVFNTDNNDILIVASAGSRVEIARTLRNSTTKITKDGEGTLKLLASNLFSGGVEVKAGNLHLGHDNALGTGDLTLGEQANPNKSVGMERERGCLNNEAAPFD